MNNVFINDNGNLIHLSDDTQVIPNVGDSVQINADDDPDNKGLYLIDSRTLVKDTETGLWWKLNATKQ